MPTVVATSNATTHASSTSGGTSHVMTLPTGSGGLLVAFLAYNEPSSGTVISAWSGWTQLGRTNFGTAPDGYVEVWYSTSAVGATTTATTNQNTRLHHIFKRISDYQGVPAIGSFDTNSGGGVGSTTTDPPSLTSGFGAVDTLWFAVCGYGSGDSRTVSSYPSGYSNGLTERNNTSTSNHAVAIAQKTSTAASEDPGVFTLSGTSWQSGVTVAIRGSTPFTADFTGTPLAGELPVDVAFTDTSSGGTGTPDTWWWDFGDGEISVLQNPNHSYLTAGSYTVTLTVTTDDDEIDTETKVAYVSASEPYVSPDPSNAVIEIRAASPGSARWGTALWGVAVWSSAGWRDVTPQSVDATVRWGSHRPEAGILTETEAATWLVNTYDPERLLDPGNPDGPYAADLRAGLPIRIRHRGTIVRQGIAETIAFYHKDSAGGIRVTDNLSLYARTPVPEDSVLSDTLRARARDAISAAGLPVMVEPDPPAGDPALAPRLEGDRSVWRHIADAAQQVLHIAYIDRLGTVRFRPWATPYDRGRVVDETMLIDLGTLVSTAGLYSVVQAQETIADGDTLIERRATPTPRYGPVTYTRSDATPDAEAWADAVLADRALQTVQWIPGGIYPLTANDVEYFATLEAMERLGVQDSAADPAVDVTGIIVGGSFQVVSERDAEAVWSFELELAQTADTPLYGSEDPLTFVTSSAGDEYVYPS